MKKIIIIFSLLFLCLNNIFAYFPTENDSKILQNVYTKIDPICEKSPKSCEIFNKKLDNIKKKYNENPRIYYFLWEIQNHIKQKIWKITNNKNNISENKVFVYKVIDWDTIVFEKDWKKITARLIGIDAPENSKTRYWHTEKLWNEAKNFLEKLILNKNVKIEYDSSQAKTDKYWRHLIYIFFAWENINRKIIKAWLAKEYTYNKPYKYQKEFKNAEQYAKNKKLWIWWLEENTQKEVIKNISNHDIIWECKIKGNINNKWKKIYHLPSCKSYNQTKISLEKWEKWFCSETEAINAWWIKAWNCE